VQVTVLIFIRKLNISNKFNFMQFTHILDQRAYTRKKNIFKQFEKVNLNLC